MHGLVDGVRASDAKEKIHEIGLIPPAFLRRQGEPDGLADDAERAALVPEKVAPPSAANCRASSVLGKGDRARARDYDRSGPVLDSALERDLGIVAHADGVSADDPGNQIPLVGGAAAHTEASRLEFGRYRQASRVQRITYHGGNGGPQLGPALALRRVVARAGPAPPQQLAPGISDHGLGRRLAAVDAEKQASRRHRLDTDRVAVAIAHQQLPLSHLLVDQVGRGRAAGRRRGAAVDERVGIPPGAGPSL